MVINAKTKKALVGVCSHFTYYPQHTYEAITIPVTRDEANIIYIASGSMTKINRSYKCLYARHHKNG